MLYVAEPTTAGLAQCLADWTAGLAARGWDVSLACPTTGWLADTCRAHGVTVYPWEARGEPHKGISREFTRLRSVIKRVDPDVVHLNGAKAGFIGRWALHGRRPTVYSPHAWAMEATSGPKATAGLQWERFATRWTDAIIAVSDTEAQTGRDYGIHANYLVARNGVDLTAVTPATDRGAVRESLGIAPDDAVAVCVGRMWWQKGQDVLLQAWPDVAGNHRQLHLLGDGPMLDELRAANSGPDVHFHGDVERVESLAWLQAADVVVVPSRWEGMALVPMESLAMGTPVVASDVPGIREAIGQSEFGTLVPPEETEPLAQALRSWLDVAGRSTADGDVAIRDERRRWVEQEFDVATTVETISAILTDLVDS